MSTWMICASAVNVVVAPERGVVAEASPSARITSASDASPVATWLPARTDLAHEERVVVRDDVAVPGGRGHEHVHRLGQADESFGCLRPLDARAGDHSGRLRGQQPCRPLEHAAAARPRSRRARGVRREEAQLDLDGEQIAREVDDDRPLYDRLTGPERLEEILGDAGGRCSPSSSAW